MNTVKNFATIHLRINQTDLLEVVILIMTILTNYVFQIKQEDVNLSMFNMITGICNTPNDYSNKVCVSNKPDDMNLSLFNMITGINQSRIYHANVNVDLMEENEIHINGRIMIYIDVSGRKVMYMKKVMFRIQLHVILKLESIQQVSLATQ